MVELAHRTRRAPARPTRSGSLSRGVDFLTTDISSADKLTVPIMAVDGYTSAPPTLLLTGWALDPSQQQPTKRGSGMTDLKPVFGR